MSVSIKVQIFQVKQLAWFTFLFLVTVMGQCIAQQSNIKPPVTAAQMNNWPTIKENGNVKISNDGQYVCYVTANLPIMGMQKMTIQSLNGNWKRSLTNISGFQFQFCADSKKLIVIKGIDSLVIIKMGEEQQEILPNIDSFKISEDSEQSWVAFSNNSNKVLTLRSLSDNRTFSFPLAITYELVNGKLIFVQKSDEADKVDLVTFDLVTTRQKKIWNGYTLSNITFNRNRTRMAFMGGQKASKLNADIWLLNLNTGGLDNFTDLFHSENGKILKNCRIVGFSKNDQSIYITETHSKNEVKLGSVKDTQVDVWSYQDAVLQSRQLALNKSESSTRFTCILFFKDKKVYRIEGEGEKLVDLTNGKVDNDSYLILNTKFPQNSESNWNRFDYSDYKVINLLDSTKSLKLTRNAVSPMLSPDERYCIYYDTAIRNYVSINLSSRLKKVISKSVNTKWTSFDRADDAFGANFPMGIAGWSKDGEGVLIYDQNDIYLFDLDGTSNPINLTMNFGKQNNITFRLALNPLGKKESIQIEDRLLLCGFNRSTKEDGLFWHIGGKTSSMPEKLTVQPKLIVGTNEYEARGFIPPVKARDTDIYVLRIESEKESPNLFFTKNFKTFNPISDVYPERNFNWHSTELINWKTLDNISAQGILYKPENFDPSKKYPMIVLYYEKFSAGLHQFEIIPFSEGSEIRISEYVSNGYLVFVPDIHYIMGNPGKSAYNSIMPALKKLTTYSWVNVDKIGLNGHSFGGYETNYLITHSSLFAAACANSGWSNFTSASNRVRSFGISALYYYEKLRQRMDANMWERPDLYIQASPIFQAHKVTTPLLMMNNKGDGDVDFPEGLQFFLALRRLGKRAWMLQYDNGDHSLTNPEDIKDLNTRMRQFFDHYLKGAEAPKWMTRGVPASMKGIDSGLELDREIKTPGSGLLTEDALKKAEALINRKPIEVVIK